MSPLSVDTGHRRGSGGTGGEEGEPVQIKAAPKRECDPGVTRRDAQSPLRPRRKSESLLNPLSALSHTPQRLHTTCLLVFVYVCMYLCVYGITLCVCVCVCVFVSRMHSWVYLAFSPTTSNSLPTDILHTHFGRKKKNDFDSDNEVETQTLHPPLVQDLVQNSHDHTPAFSRIWRSTAKYVRCAVY